MRSRSLIVATLGCLLLCAVTLTTRRITPAFAGVGIEPHGSFRLNGQYPGDPLPHAAGVRFWGSWSGSDENTGALVIGPFPAPTVLRFAVTGYPNVEGNQISLERLDTHAQQKVLAADFGNNWAIVDLVPPPDWVGQPVRLIAIDQAKSIDGWIGISEPILGGHGDGNYALIESLAAWTASGLVFGLLWLAALNWLEPRDWVARHWLPLVAAGFVAALGYVTFWAYFAHAIFGQIVSTALTLGAFYATWQTPHAPSKRDDESLAPALLLLVIGVLYLALLHLFPSSREFYNLAANRFRENLPGDNTLPHNMAFDLFHGHTLRWPGADWLSSDRPPLQTGWLLLSWPLTAALQLDQRNAGALASVWFQSIWVFGVYGLLRTLGLTRRRTCAWLALIAFTGFFLQNTVFTWPKLSAGAFACGTFGLWLTSADAVPRRSEIWCGAALAGLACLSHGGVAFSFLIIAPWFGLRLLRRDWRAGLIAAVVFAAFAVPWMAYQKFYDPPGNRLVKWHLGGQIAKDDRGVWQTIREDYQRLSWSEIVSVRVTNFRFQVAGDWRWWHDFSPSTAQGRRNNEFFAIGRGLTWWLLGVAALPFALARKPHRIPWRSHAALTAWTIGTVVVWCLLLFGTWQASIHQGSYAVMFGLFCLLSVWLDLASKWAIVLIGLLQFASFTTTWAIPNALVHGPLNLLALFIAIAAASVLLGYVARAAGQRDQVW